MRCDEHLLDYIGRINKNSMAKGAKLKELLAHQKENEKQIQKEQLKKVKATGQEPKSAASEDMQKAKKPADESVKIASNEKSDEEYHSQALSKKERRKLKKLQKKQQKDEPEEQAENSQDEAEEQDDLDPKKLNLEALEESESEGSEEDEDEIEAEAEVDQNEDDEDQDVPLSDVEFDSDADVVPYQKLTINNTNALKHALERIQLPWSKHSFQEHQSITSSSNTDEGIKDIYDDTERELSFYKQSLNAVVEAREKLKKLKVPFNRPLDYFAEMVKSDEHMDKLKAKLVEEASEKKAREDARKQRQLKKFGKQVQVATLQQRQKDKRETLDKIKSLKKKRKHNEIQGEDFDVGIEEATEEKKFKPNAKRQAKNSKYGQGGMKRFKRKNDAESSADIPEFSHRKMKGKAPRPGKSRRQRRY